jgi:hypothetical protein
LTLSFATLHACPMYYANKIEIHLFLNYWDTTLYTFTQNVIQNKTNVAWKNVGTTPCTIVPKMCVPKKKTKMVNVYKLSILISKEEEVPYPNLPPTTTTITTTTTAMNLSRPSYYKKQKKWKKHRTIGLMSRCWHAHKVLSGNWWKFVILEIHSTTHGGVSYVLYLTSFTFSMLNHWHCFPLPTIRT